MISSLVNKLSSSSSSSVSSASSTSSPSNSNSNTSNATVLNKFLKLNKKSTNSTKKQNLKLKIFKNDKSTTLSAKKSENLKPNISIPVVEKQESTPTSSTKEMNFSNLNSFYSERLINQPFECLNLNENKNNHSESENAISESLFCTSISSPQTTTSKLLPTTHHQFKQELTLDNLSLETTTSKQIKETLRFIDEPEYRMNHSKRGYAIIINNKRFDSRLEMPVRDGTDLDAACLESTFKKLGFDTKLFHNCSAMLIRDLMFRYSKADFSDMDCFACVLMSHGENGIIYGIDKEIEIEQIIQPFKFNRSLAGKPKLFFIQACRGTQLMEGIDSNPFDVQYVNKIPMEADFLIAYSTIAGFYSWRNSLNGSWFIQSLCQVMNDNGKKWKSCSC